MRNIKNNEEGIAPLLIILALVGMAAGGGVVFAIAPQMMMIYFLFVGFFLIGLVALKSGPKMVKLLIPLFAAVVVLVLIFSFIPLPWLTTVPLNFSTDTKSRDIEGWRGEGNPNWNGELLDSMRYITSPEKDEDSEKIVIQGRICLVSGTPGPWDTHYKYVYYTYDAGWNYEDEWEEEMSTMPIVVNGCVNTETDIYHLEYGYSGFFKVELQIHFDWPFGEKYWRVVATDMAYVKEGKAEVSWMKTRYEVGETAQLKYETGYCLSSKHHEPGSGNCYLRVFSWGKGEYVIDIIVPQNDKDVIPYVVTMADFSTHADCMNYLEATIENKLVEIDDDDTTVIDFAELGPSKPKITTDKSSYNVGDTISIEFESEANSETNLPIDKYHIQISYQDPTVVMVDEWVTTTSFSFSGTTEPGTIAIEVFCQDEGCRPSEITTKFVKVYAEGDIRGELPLPWILILLLVVMLILGIAIFYFAKGIPLPLKILIMIILLIIPLALWWMGVIY